MPTIHQTAIIEEGATIAKDVTIGAFCYIGKDVTIGEGTTIASHAVIEGDTTIGKNNRIFSHTAIGTIPQDLKYQGEPVSLVIGDGNTIREFALINPGTKGGGSLTKIGSHNLFMGYVHIGHDAIVGDHCILANGATLAGHVVLGNYAVIGGLTPIHQFVHIGEYAMVGGASAVSQDIPPFCLAQGNHATLRGLNLVGLRRNLQREEINTLKRAYKQLFEEGKPLQETTQALLETTHNPHIEALCHFIQNSQRGIPFVRK
jgi:UDP-N-acetylglucosamine acyltransferase